VIRREALIRGEKKGKDSAQNGIKANIGVCRSDKVHFNQKKTPPRRHTSTHDPLPLSLLVAIEIKKQLHCLSLFVKKTNNNACLGWGEREGGGREGRRE